MSAIGQFHNIFSCYQKCWQLLSKLLKIFIHYWAFIILMIFLVPRSSVFRLFNIFSGPNTTQTTAKPHSIINWTIGILKNQQKSYTGFNYNSTSALHPRQSRLARRCEPAPSEQLGHARETGRDPSNFEAIYRSLLRKDTCLRPPLHLCICRQCMRWSGMTAYSYDGSLYMFMHCIFIIYF